MELLLGLTDLGAVSRSQTMCLWKKASSKKKKKKLSLPAAISTVSFWGSEAADNVTSLSPLWCSR